jgi:hypothetical protein
LSKLGGGQGFGAQAIPSAQAQGYNLQQQQQQQQPNPYGNMQPNMNVMAGGNPMMPSMQFQGQNPQQGMSNGMYGMQQPVNQQQFQQMGGGFPQQAPPPVPSNPSMQQQANAFNFGSPNTIKNNFGL